LDALFSRFKPHEEVTMPRGRMDELLNTQISSIGLILRFKENFKKAGKKNMKKGFLIHLELLKEYWKQAHQNHVLLLNYEGIKSKDYIKDDVYAEAEVQ